MKDLLLSLELKTPEELGDLLIGAVLSLKQSDKIVEDVDPQEKFTLEYMIPGLLELGADVNLIREQEEPFHLYHKSVMEHAVLKGRLDLLRLLVSYGGDLEYRDKFAMTMGLAPVVGVPLPLMSYGGSSVMVTCIALGILVSVDRNRTVF